MKPAADLHRDSTFFELLGEAQRLTKATGELNKNYKSLLEKESAAGKVFFELLESESYTVAQIKEARRQMRWAEAATEEALKIKVGVYEQCVEAQRKVEDYLIENYLGYTA